MRLSKIAKVPKNEQDEFCKRISDCVIRLQDRHTISFNPSKALKDAASAARNLQQIFYRLNRRNRERLEKTRQSEIRFKAGEIIDLESTILNLAILFSTAIGISPLVPHHLARVRFTVKDQLLRELVFCLLSATEDARGKLRFNVNSGSGSLAAALKLISTYLPEGLVPEHLPDATIQRLKTEFFKMRNF